MKSKRISIITSGHPPFDDRIFWKFGNSLIETGFEVSIICSTKNINENINEISIIGFDGSGKKAKEKITQLTTLIGSVKPDLIICEEMLPTFAAINYRRKNKKVKIILDVTEWYPENVAFKLTGLKRWIKYLQLFLPYIFTLNQVDHLIVGEITKLKRYNFISPFIPKSIIGYYPVLKYFNYKQPEISSKEIIFGYAGVVTFERGILNVLNTCISVSSKYPNKKIKLLVFGKFTYQVEEAYFKQKISLQNQIEVEFADWTSYDKMSPIIEKMDICFDLRKRNFIYNNSLPIKIFEYMACGKPFIFSEIDPIKKELAYINYGFLVDPDNETNIVETVKYYLDNPEIAKLHSMNARKVIENNFNWESESKKLLKIVNQLLV
ncbi:MAG: glycosyltransferase [Ignavibacteriaceae bacterium]